MNLPNAINHALEHDRQKTACEHGWEDAAGNPTVCTECLLAQKTEEIARLEARIAELEKPPSGRR